MAYRDLSKEYSCEQLEVTPNRTMRLATEAIGRIDAEIAQLQAKIDALTAAKEPHQAMHDNIKAKLQRQALNRMIYSYGHEGVGYLLRNP